MIVFILFVTIFFLLCVVGKALYNVRRDEVPFGIVPFGIVTLDMQDGETAASRYRPMCWLLNESDYRLVAAAFPDKGHLRSIRRERIALFRMYLRALGADHTRMVGAIRRVLVESDRDRPGLPMAMYRCQMVFFWAMVVIEVKLLLHALGIGVIDARSLVATVDRLQLQLADLLFVEAVG